jgi:nitrogenase molybdenum-iron protein alpha/beta subunit
MKNTFDKLGKYMQKKLTHIYVKGHDAHSISDALSKGMHVVLTGKFPGERLVPGDSEELEENDDEVMDDGSLDV